jgi:hypothetical protein
VEILQAEHKTTQARLPCRFIEGSKDPSDMADVLTS